MKLDYRGLQLKVSGSYDGAFVMYRTFGELNSADQRVRAYMEHRATSRLKIFAEE